MSPLLLFLFVQAVPSVFQSCFWVFVILVAMSCLLIGSKIEEELRPVSRLIRVFHQMYQQRIGEPITELSDTDPVLLTVIFDS